MIEEVSAQYLKELQAEKEELEKNYSDNAHAIKLLQNGKGVKASSTPNPPRKPPIWKLRSFLRSGGGYFL